jgi:PAS domain S-box-containing protein
MAGCLVTFGLFWEHRRSRLYRRPDPAELERRTLAERYAYLSRYGNDIVLLLDERGRIIEANDRAVATYGYSLDELLRLSVRDLLDPSEWAGFSRRWEDPERKSSELYEMRHRRKDGSGLSVEVSSRLFAVDGRVLRHGIIRDITGRKQSEDRLHRVTRAMRVLSASNQAVVRAGNETELYHDICAAITDTGGYPLAWIGFAEHDSQRSVRTVALSGRNTEYLSAHGITWSDEPHGRGPVGRCIRTGQIALSNDVDRDPGFEPWRQNAERFGFKSVVALPLLCEGALIGALTIYASEPDAFYPEEMHLIEELVGDLSYGIEVRRRELQRAEAERALRQSEMEFRTLFDSATDVILIRDLDGRILEVNSVACRRLGYSREELLSMTVNDIDSPAFAGLLSRRMAMVAERGEALFETAHVRKDGLETPVEISCRVFEYRGAPAVLSMARDITERKRAESEAQARAAELERAKTEAEDANRAKGEFLANMSHEIRTPMNGIIGMTAILLDTPLTPTQRDYAETVRRSADALLAIVNNVLDFSRIEAGGMELESVVFDIAACLAETGGLMAAQAREKGLEYVFQAETEHHWVRGDAGRVRQIVLNLLSNAIKFTEQGQVTLGFASTSAAPDGDRGILAVSVTDTGMGIAADDLPLIFRKFTQLDSSLGKRHEGTGLGLAISRQLAEMMGGALTAASDLGHGATFTLTLPLVWDSPPCAAARGPDQPAAPSETEVPVRRRRILLAEDNAVNRKIGVLVLEKLGCSVDVAANGREAAEMADRCSYDLIFMDCAMPEMDGYAATRHIRERQSGDRRVPIVALTAHAIEGARERCLDAGMDDYVAKPISPAALERTVVKWSPSDPSPMPG